MKISENSNFVFRDNMCGQQLKSNTGWSPNFQEHLKKAPVFEFTIP
jgi:hypothetical protein